MKNFHVILAATAALLVGGCRCFTDGTKTDAEGFTYMDGSRVATSAPSDYYVIRYEQPSAEPFEDGRKRLGTRWLFTEVRQLKDSVTIVTDGVLKKETKRRLPGLNWRRWLASGARNVRVKFVDENYSLAADGRAETPAGFTSLFNGKDLTG